jgi:hypothetical protein
MESF